MKIKIDQDLSKLNTFGIEARAKFLAEVRTEDELADLLETPEFKNNPKLITGGGSNILFTKDFDGIVVINKLKGIEILKEDNANVWIRSMGGEMWNDLVLFAVDKGYWGIENLSLVPGTVGAAPMQNIGAYGGELKNTLENVEAYNIQTGEKRVFSKEECALGYRDSVFKNALKGKYFISAITLKLSKIPKENITYRVLKEYLETNHILVQTPKDVSEAVAAIRKSKLPDPKILGNAGSFFKNVFVSKDELARLLSKFPEAPYFTEEESVKIPAGWLIEQCGFKGKREGRVGMHEKQALVLVNYGGATGPELLAFAQKIMNCVKEKFGLDISPEVNIV